MNRLALLACLAFLPACDALRAVAPQTVAGFEAGGVLGALDGASGAVLARCRTFDGQLVRVAVDTIAISAGAGPVVERTRAARQHACRVAGAISTLADVSSADSAAPF